MASAAMAGLVAPARAATNFRGAASADLLWTLVTALCVLLTGGVLFAALRLTLGGRAGADGDAIPPGAGAQGNGGPSR